MKTYRHSKFEIIHIEPNEDIGKLSFKRDFFLSEDMKKFLSDNSVHHCYIVLDKKENKNYGIITLEINEWDGIATFDFNELENHPDKNAMHRLSMLLCHLANDISKNAKTIVFKNHLFDEEVLSILWKENFRYKDEKSCSDIFIRFSDRESEGIL